MIDDAIASMRKLTKTTIATLIVLGAANAAIGVDSDFLSQPGPSTKYTWRACNDRVERVHVAIAYYQGATAINKGWYTVMPNSCRDILTLNNNARVDYYAETDERWHWSGDGKSNWILICRPGPYELVNKNINGQWKVEGGCPAGATQDNVSGIRAGQLLRFYPSK